MRCLGPLRPEPHCNVVAPSLVPVRAGDRVKTDRRDAKKLVTLGGGLGNCPEHGCLGPYLGGGYADSADSIAKARHLDLTASYEEGGLGAREPYAIAKPSERALSGSRSGPDGIETTCFLSNSPPSLATRPGERPSAVPLSKVKLA